MPNNLSSLCGIINKIKEVMMVREGMYTKIGRGNSYKKKKKKKKKHLQDRNKWVSNTKMGNAKQVVRTRSEWKQTTWMGFTLAGFCWECLSSRKIREGWMWITSLQNTKNVTILSIKLSNFKRRWTSNMNILFNFNLYTPFLSRTKLISNQLIKALRKI